MLGKHSTSRSQQKSK